MNPSSNHKSLTFALDRQFPRKVTPEASRTIVQVTATLSSDGVKQGSDFVCNSKRRSSIPFVDMDRTEQRPLLPRPDASKRAQDLLRVLPVRKFGLRRRPQRNTSGSPAPSIVLPSLPPVEQTEASDTENQEPCFTPAPPSKRPRFSSPPALHQLFASRELLLPDTSSVPAKLMFPTI
ncbi:expressed unknown protein [Seminavis robusta]|uniref:Uncharacterized protein n=1 Tax=Seminavis robusta TaxID=568900 RepID=A0A9N8E0S9_9STRA|nr:expressed unknown protein [Seminavis robusta]|eukprot:Sro435_g142280.1 n/a (178) ;mRNA; f:18713-19246